MKTIQKTFKYIGIFLLILLSYGILVTLLSFIPINKDKMLSDNSNVAIYILSNGVHTDIVVPVKNEYHDWSKQIKFEHTKAKDTTAKYLAIGWGDRGFYLETPTWADLKVSTALKATTGLSSSALHATFYKVMKEDAYCKKIQISKEEYLKLIAFISESFETKTNSILKIDTEAVYGKNDAFYEAKGSYSLFYTCNSWANEALKSANQKAALHTLTDTGIFRHYEK
ncbi:TIGR02117 family protein [Flavobacterium difficile]|uniref:TIGR02117 family protein n=1 Tax=Flavobacterium difficile TaxID=2709659 RepID=A0ABX0I7Z6_9FLAO|nr:TIGR02117 family protein [Flavobacterium difficile]NHM01615.1 TIGR02117 family protein [Flavobacterium difficile]